MSVVASDGGSGAEVHGGVLRHVMVVAAMERETAPLRRRLERACRRPRSRRPEGDEAWRIATRDASKEIEVTVTHCGVGAAAVRDWLERLELLDEKSPEILIVGYAGGLDPACRPGDVVWATEGGAIGALADCTEVHSRWHSGAAGSGGRGGRPSNIARPNDSSTGSVWSVSEPLLDPDAKRRLWSGLGRLPAALVDMETAELASGLRGRGIPTNRIAVCRVVTDAADEGLPSVVGDVQPSGTIPAGRLLAAITRRPATVVSLVRLARRANQGAAHLANEIERWLLHATP